MSTGYTFFYRNRGSCPEVFCKKGVLGNFTKFTGKHLSLRPATLLKKELWHSFFLLNFAKFLSTSFLQNTPGRLLLDTKSLSCKRICFPMTHSFKEYLKIVKIHMVNFNVTVFNRLIIIGFFIDKW